MDLGLKHKVVLITGGSKGIGLATARAFAAEGARVVIASRSEDNLRRAQEVLAADGAKVDTVRADFSRTEDAAKALDEAERRAGPIDILVNSAGAARRSLPEAVNEAAWRGAFEAKFLPYVNAQDAVIARLRSRAGAPVGTRPGRQHGSIVNIVGMGGLVASPTHLTGGAANAGLLLATLGLAKHYAAYGIRINAINPGITHTDRVEQNLIVEAQRLGISREEALARGEAATPLRRYGDPDEIANAVLFLASERASYIVGALIAVDGGQNTVL